MNHVVSVPRAPFTTANGRLTVHQLPAWQDNLVWLIACNETGDAAIVDGPDAEASLACCREYNLTLRAVLNTHTHGDHVGVNRDLAKRGLLASLRVYGRERTPGSVPGLTHPVGEQDVVHIGNVTGEVLLTEGHLNGHVSYVFDDVLFCGDTLFGAGCGYLFDGPPESMKKSLDRLASLPANTRVCCAHEYTQDNLRFAWSVEPSNDDLRKRIQDTWALRARGESSVPSTIEIERRTNPFLRHESIELRQHVSRTITPEADTPAGWFAATRKLKDAKHYRSIEDEQLPLAGGMSK
jgi:hydroxyacylglutathione hydrolase